MSRLATVRATVAAGLLSALVALLLGVWFVSGWSDVRARQAEMEKAPYAAAEERAAALARDLRVELDGLLAREVRRPYFHYQNLMHDPQTSAGVNVSRSPLAGGADEKLVLGYFQLDAKGRATTPTVNDEVPEMSNTEHLARNRAFRDRVAQDLSRDLKPTQKPARQRAAGSARTAGSAAARPPSTSAASAPLPKNGSQTIQIDPRIYVQNANPTATYQSQQGGYFPPPPPPVAPEPVTITISSLEWRTMLFAGEPTLIAIRQVDTPDRVLTQGFVVDRDALTAWLAAKAGDTIPVLGPGGSVGAPVAPHWGLTVMPNPQSVAAAGTESRAIASSFALRFAAVGAVSVVAAVLVLLLVTRAETLARERSQFAAAAAHELRTPLAGLQLYGDMLADGLGDPDKTREYARRMSDDAARLGRVVSNIFGFSQLERGNLAIELQTGAVGEALRELGERTRPEIERLGASLEMDVAGDTRAVFDRDLLARIVGNLLDNAEKYARHAVDRTIRLSATDRGDAVEVSVSDRGPGVRDSAKLFRVFSRGTSGHDGPAGLGLGLALSRSLARAMGGDLIYQVRDGGGATFVLRLRRE